MGKYLASPYCCGVLKDYVDVNPPTDCSKLSDNSIVSFVPMTNVQEKTNMVTYDDVPYEKVKKGFTVFKKGDMIWAKITPCMQNGKSCIVDQMPTEIGFGSTEFHVIRNKDERLYMPYLWAILSNDNVLKAAQAVFNGSAGQQRVSSSFIERFPAVIPDYNKQISLVFNLEEKLKQFNEKVFSANELIKNSSFSIMNSLEINSINVNKPCFAIKLSDLDGVIDAKRYVTLNNKPTKHTIADICEVIDSKVNVSSYKDREVDWIRIDDLPNQPIDIAQVRTMPASEIDGTFFEVQENDILVARLGPTILNQKIVMVRHTERTTIASAEFLVLRCKEGYNPEAVMAILKTPYYRDLMYSHSRGSTPSRYRLNREDMLKLPFPDITDTQTQIANNATEVRNKVVSLRTEAEQEWQTAKEQFEKELLGETNE